MRISIVFCLACGLLWATTASATQPPPPTEYVLMVTKVGGDSDCWVGQSPGGPWDLSSSTNFYAPGTEVEPEFREDCPTTYSFDHWESNESTVDGETGNHYAGFEISKDTYIQTYFEDLWPKITGFHESSRLTNSDTGMVTVNYQWSSESGNVQDLLGQVHEVLTYDLDAGMSELLTFLCTFENFSDETTSIPGFPALGTVPVWIKWPMPPASDGQFPDGHHGMICTQNRPTNCTTGCAYEVKQWYVLQCGFFYVVSGPYTLRREFELQGGEWRYCFTKGSKHCFNLINCQ